MNFVLYPVSKEINNSIHIDSIKGKTFALSVSTGCEISKNSEDTVKTLTAQAMNTLSDCETGFGRLGMIFQKGDKYIINSHMPDYPVCAYVIYNQWPQGSTAYPINDLINAPCNLGRIFFLGSEEVMAVLEQMEARNLIKLETMAGLNQIVRNPELTELDIIRMM